MRPLIFAAALSLSGALLAFAQADLPAAEIVNDEGGPVAITGEVTYTNTFFTAGVAQPLVILEDQAGFVDRDRGFLMPEESQVLGQITSDFFTSPFGYSISLPIEPQGSLRDVDNDGEEDTGVQVFAIAYWTNIFGGPVLEERDLFGGGWSTAYASTSVSSDPSAEGEIIGGKFLIYAPDDAQGFPSGFGEDGLLFTADDPIVGVPQGYTIVDMDADPFVFDRSANPVVDLIEPEFSALDDFSELSFVDAFDAMVEKMRAEYAFTEYKNIDWDEMIEEFRPRFAAAQLSSDFDAYALALRDFTWSIPDGHVSASSTPALNQRFSQETADGLGMAIRDVDDGRVIVNFLTPEGPAEQAGIELRAEILDINGFPIEEAIELTVPWSSPFSTPDFRRLQQLRYVMRFPSNSEVELTYQNPGDSEPTTVTLTTSPERESFNFSSFNVGLTGLELPVEYQVIPPGIGYVRIYSFLDNELLTVQLWERMMQTFNQAGVPALIVDMRQNGGGSGFLADQLAAYFFNEPHVLGFTAFYDEELDDFFIDTERPDLFYLPPEELRYQGEVAVLVGPNCASACEGFSYATTIDDRAAIVGHYPTAGLGGSVQDFLMPGPLSVRFTIGRGLDADENIHIEGIGVVPTVRVPVTEETLFYDGDPVLDTAVDYLVQQVQGNVAQTSALPGEGVTVRDGDVIAVGDVITDEIAAGERVRYVLFTTADTVLNIALGDAAGTLDTYLRLFDLDDNLLAENDDSVPGETINSLIAGFEFPANEILVIEVATFQDAAAGTYELSVTAAE
ncbi:MAG: peptidase S41 [Chloroflexi bacterium]|nr:peptidase S41 [Chloroflexota bacterium]